MRLRRTYVDFVLPALLATGSPAQGPTLEVAFSSEAATSGVPAISWLCGTMLPLRAEWPKALASDQSFVVRLDDKGLSIAANNVALPAGALFVGSVELASSVRALCTCTQDGTEDWYVPLNAQMPRDWSRLLLMLRASDIDRAHTIDAGVAVGHLLGATATGDPTKQRWQLGAAICGEVTWNAWRNEQHLRVRGRSDGGLLLPAVLFLLAHRSGSGTTEPLPLRAFSARDGDREEALRQLAQSSSASRPTLLAMLYGNDELRLTAIDSLVRLGATEELPRIVAAAGPELPLTTIAATDALQAMWSDASSSVKARTRAAISASASTSMRDIDPEKLAAAAKVPEDARTGRLLMFLLIIGAGLLGFWLRERARLRAFV